MRYYKLRIDLVGMKDYEVIDVVEKRVEPCYMYSIEDEDGKNPHMHWYVEMFDDKVSRSLRQDLRDMGFKGNSSYSLKELDERLPIEYMSYIMKQGRFWWKNIDNKLLEEFQAYDEKIKKEIKEKKANRKTQLQQCMEAYDEYCKEGNVNSLCYHMNAKRENIIRFVIDFCSKDNKLIREFQIVSICQTMLLKYDSTYYCDFNKRIIDKVLL